MRCDRCGLECPEKQGSAGEAKKYCGRACRNAASYEGRQLGMWYAFELLRLLSDEGRSLGGVDVKQVRAFPGVDAVARVERRVAVWAEAAVAKLRQEMAGQG